MRDLTEHGYLGKLEIAAEAPLVAAAGEPVAPEEVLRQYGVRLDDGLCVLADEAQVLETVSRAQGSYAEAQMASIEQQALFNAAVVLPELQGWVNQYQFAIAGIDRGMDLIRQHGRGMHHGAHQAFQLHKKQLQAELDRVKALVGRLQRRAVEPDAAPKLAAAYQRHWQNYDRARDEFRRQAAATRKKYKELRNNKELRIALDVLGRRLGWRFDLVPSDEFLYIVEWFEEAQRNERLSGN